MVQEMRLRNELMKGVVHTVTLLVLNDARHRFEEERKARVAEMSVRSRQRNDAMEATTTFLVQVL